MCIFCDIVKGEAPCECIREDEQFMAFLDIFPNTKGQTIVIPKEHYDSDFFALSPKIYGNYLEATQKVVNLLKSTLQIERVGMVMEGMGVNHVHLKLYPLWGVDKGRKPKVATQEQYFVQYAGYLSTQPGPKAPQDTLHELKEKFVKNLTK